MFLTPWMVAPAVGATIWLWLLEPQFGVVNYLLQAAGLVARAASRGSASPGTAFASVVAVDVWRGVPFVMLLMLAGLQTIPREQYEAARDRRRRARGSASATSRWPNLRYLLVVASTLDVINTIRHYDIIGVMTGGGPAGATEVLPVLIYNTAFRGNRFGEAAAIGVLLLADRARVLAIVYVRITRPDEDGARDDAQLGPRAGAAVGDRARRAGRDDLPVLLDAQHVAQARRRRSSRRRRRSCRRSGRSTPTRRPRAARRSAATSSTA